MGNGYAIGEYSYTDRNLLGTRLQSQLLERDRDTCCRGGLTPQIVYEWSTTKFSASHLTQKLAPKDLGVNFILRLAWSRVPKLTLFHPRERDVRTQASGVAFCVVKTRVYWSLSFCWELGSWLSTGWDGFNMLVVPGLGSG